MTPVAKFAFPMRAACAAALVAGLSGCATNEKAGVEPGPMATPQVVTVVPGVPTGPAPTGPQNTGYYPGFSQPLTSAALQMTPEEASAQEKQLSGLGASGRRGTISEAEYKRRQAAMRKLAADHRKDTLSEIRE